MESITKCLATNVRTLRKMKKMTQSEVAEKAGISLVFLQGIETEKKWVSPMTTKSIAKALGVTESQLFENCFERKSLKVNRYGYTKLAHVPDDIFMALATTCASPNWKWEPFRWILQGYERNLYNDF